MISLYISTANFSNYLRPCFLAKNPNFCPDKGQQSIPFHQNNVLMDSSTITETKQTQVEDNALHIKNGDFKKVP